MRVFWCILLAIWPLCGSALDIKGTDYMGLREVAGRFGMQTRWIEKGQTLALESKWTKMSFTIHKREMSLNGNRIFLGYPVAESSGRLYLSTSDFTHQLKPILTPQSNGKVPKLHHIMLDPGHGGKDPGAENAAIGLREKTLTLDLAKRVARQLQAHGFRVSLTRQDDRFHSLETRAQKANQEKADLFVSLHFNATGSGSVSGVETFAFTPPFQPSSSRTKLHSSDRKAWPGNINSGWNALAAYYVQRSLIKATGATDRGLKRARFTVLRDLQMPGLLVEGGFVTNNTEGRNIGSAAYRDKLAKAIVDGILVYQRSLDRHSVKAK